MARRLIILLLLTLIPAAWAHADLTLVKNGAPAGAIIIPADASATLKLAATELRDHIKLMSGAELPIVNEGGPPVGVSGGVMILVGPTSQTQALKLPLTDAKIGYDGFIIKTRPNALILCGRNDAGTLNAVYGFLEDHLDVRWYYPGPYGTDVPQRDTISVGAMDEISKPRYMVRSPWYNSNVTAGCSDQELAELSVWLRRNRCGGVTGYVGHQWASTIPPSTYFSTHPEYYSLIQGKRNPAQLCTSNPDVIDLYSKDAIATFAADPNFKYYSASPNDGTGWCECDNCKAVSADLTSRILTFINKVADNTRAQFPDRLIAFYAYSSIVNPPTDNIKCAPNVMPWVAHYSICQIHPLDDPNCPYQARFRGIYDGWRGISQQLGVREYASWWPVPCAETERLARDDRYYAEHGTVAMSREYLELEYGSHLLQWVESKMLWNPDTDLEVLLSDFFNRFYGDAGPQMRQIYDMLAAQEAIAGGNDGNLTGNMYEAPGIYPRQMLADAVEMAKAAEAAAEPGMFRDRVTRERLALEHGLLFDDAWVADRAAARSGADAERAAAVDVLNKVIALRNSMPDNLIVSSQSSRYATDELSRLTANRTHITKAGNWELLDDYNVGGSLMLDAEKVTGLQLGTYGPGLAPGGEGYIQYHFTAEGDLRFKTAELWAMLLGARSGLQTRVEVQKENGEWQTLAENPTNMNNWDNVFPLTQLMGDAKDFRLRIWAKNDSGQDVLLLDNFGIRGTVE